MIDRLIGLFQVLNHFFVWLGDLLVELDQFVPLYIKSALAVIFFVGFFLLVYKLLVGVVNFVQKAAFAILTVLGLF